MRVTMQCGRKGSAVHNEHQHLAGDRDVLIRDFTGAPPGTPLRESELLFYKEHFGEALELQNDRHRQARHQSRIKTMEQVYTAQKTRPEEVILQVGKLGETVDRQTFNSLIQDFFKRVNRWNREHGRPFQTLNTSIHYDEATPHLHWRRVWLYEKDGISHIGQTEALKQAGVLLPERFEPESRYNNRKVTFDGFIRATWQAVCIEHGLAIETEPLPSRRHLSVDEYKDTILAERIPQLRAQISDLSEEKANLEASVDHTSEELKKVHFDLNNAHSELEALIRRREELIQRDSTAKRAAQDLMKQWGVTGKDYNSSR